MEDALGFQLVIHSSYSHLFLYSIPVHRWTRSGRVQPGGIRYSYACGCVTGIREDVFNALYSTPLPLRFLFTDGREVEGFNQAEYAIHILLAVTGIRKMINRSHTHTDREQLPRHRHTHAHDENNTPNEHLPHRNT